MAICGNCNSESNRVLSSWAGSVRQPDKCVFCSPESFEKQSDPSTKKIWTGPEFAPNDYEWRNGVQVMKLEAQAALEDKACGINSVAAQEELEALREAENHKRAHQRTKPLSQSEIEQAISFIDRTIRPMVEDPTTSYEV